MKVDSRQWPVTYRGRVIGWMETDSRGFLIYKTEAAEDVDFSLDA